MSIKKRSILVLGAGELGQAVLSRLLPRAVQHEISVHLLVRNPSSADAEKARMQGATVVQGDVSTASEDLLTRMFSGFDTVISCVGFAAGAGTQLKLAEAVLRAGCRRYFPWQFGVDYDRIGRGSSQPLFDEQYEVRRMLRAQHKTHWVIVSTGMFTSFLFDSTFGVVDLDGGAVHALGSWSNAVTVTTPEDIGSLTATIVFAQPEINDQIVYLAGDTLTYGELAHIVERALGYPIHKEIWDRERLKLELLKAPDDTFRRYRSVFADGRGVAWNKAESFNALHGIPVTDAATWLATHLALANKIG